jgi:hypothetical protein
MRTDKTDRHVTEVLRPKPDLQAWNILCEASRHDDPAIKNIADERYSARVIDQHRRPRPPEHLVHSIVRQITLDVREAMTLTGKQAFLAVRKIKMLAAHVNIYRSN